MTIKRDDPVAQALGIIPHTAEAVLKRADHAESIGLKIAAQYLRGYASVLEQHRAIADAWNDTKDTVGHINIGYLRVELRSFWPELAAALEDALTKENT